MAVKLAEGVWWFDLPGANAYLVDDGGTLTLLDAGSPRDASALRSALAEVAGGPSAVDRILVTHYDVDHVGGFGRIDGLDAPVFVGTADAPFVAGETKPSMRSRKGAFQRVFGIWARAPTGPVTAVADGDAVGGFTAYHTPGHTDGHTVYVHPELSVALLGDLVVSRDAAFELPHRFLGADAASTRASIKRLAAESPDFAVGAVGHGRPARDDGARRLRALADSLD